MSTVLDAVKLAYVPSGYKAGTTYSVIPDDGTGDFTGKSRQIYEG